MEDNKKELEKTKEVKEKEEENTEEVITEETKDDNETEVLEENKDSDTIIEGLTDDNEKELTIQEQIYEIELKIEEYEVKVEEYETILINDPENEEANKKYHELKHEEKKYYKQKKLLQKQLNGLDTSALNKVSLWVVIYGVITILISIPLIASALWLDFANWIIDLLQGAFAGLNGDTFLYKVVVFLVIFAFPLIINLVTWLLYVNLVKTKIDKKVYAIMWIIQGVMSLGMIIYMCTKLYA